MKFKTALFLTHRWLGIIMSLLFAMWFATGMVMMYVSIPALTEEEHYAGLPRLDPERISISPQAVLATTNNKQTIDHLILSSTAGRPLYLLKIKGSPWRGMYADNGELLENFTADLALNSAVSFYQTAQPSYRGQAEYHQLLDIDQWTVSSGLSSHRPLHMVAVNDPAQTQLYVSSHTGQVVRDTTRNERIWNWLGANLHWIYPLQLRRHVNIWTNLVIALSILGLVTIATGGIIGILRLRIKRPHGDQSFSPYQGVGKYHHVLGLVGLVFLTTFMFSGLMSMSPWGIFDTKDNFAQQFSRYQLGPAFLRSTPAYSSTADIQALLKQPENLATKQILWHWIGGKSHLTLHRSEGHTRYQAASETKLTLDQKIQRGIISLIPNEKILFQQRLEDYDAYYYSHHKRLRPLPILRIKFSDPESTWFHIDVTTGKILERLSYKDRLERWLFNGLHSLDFSMLINNRPVWDALVLSLCCLGLLFSVTSIVLAWRNLGEHIKERVSSERPP